MWSEQLAETNIAVGIFTGDLPWVMVSGWLLGTYHYVKDFPDVLEVAARNAAGALKDVVERYAAEEKGHETFVLGCLEKMGFKTEEVINSIPLVTMKTINMLMKELFAESPSSVLLVAAVIEACELSGDEADEFGARVCTHYDLPAGCLDGLTAHMKIDAELGHAEMCKKHRNLITFKDEGELHSVVNQIHDIKHAFDAQKLEIKQYYSTKGNYIPRQFVDYFGV